MRAVKRKSFRADNLSGYLFISPWLFGFFAFTLIPVFATLYLSFNNYDLFSAPVWVGLKNFKRMLFEDPRYWTSVKATGYFAFFGVPLKLMFALGVAMILNRKSRMVGIYRAVYYVPSIVGPSVAVAVMWREIFGSKGLLNALLAIVGLPGKTWLGDPTTALWTLIVLVIWQFGSPMLIFLAGLKQIPAELYESATIDGARGPARFRYVTLPMLSPVIFFNLVMQIIFNLTVFTPALIITGGRPMDRTLFYALYLFNRAFNSFHMGYASAMAWSILLVIAVLTAVVFKSAPYWVYYESEKGE